MSIEVIDEIVPKNGNGFPVASVNNLRGVAQVFLDEADRNAFDVRKLVVGMECKTLSPSIRRWELTTVTPLVWTEISFGGGSVDSVNGQTGEITLTAADVGAAADNDPRLSDARSPTGPAGGDFFGSNYPSPRIALRVIENNNLINVASQTIKGRASADVGEVEDLTSAQATSILDTFGASTKGLVPPSGGGTSNFLRADGSFATPGGGSPEAHAASHVEGSDPIALFDLFRVSRFGAYLAASNANVVPTPIGAPAWVETSAVQRNVANTSVFTSLQRRGYVTTAVAGVAAGGRSQAILLRDFDGFRYSIAFGISDAVLVAGARMFAGLRAAATAPTDVQIDSVINAIGVGHEAGDAGFSVFCNDAAGVATKAPLDPAKFPVTTSVDVIRLEIVTRKALGDVVIDVKNQTTNQSQTVILTTDLPALHVTLTPTLWRGNGATAAAAGVDLFRIFFDVQRGLP